MRLAEIIPDGGAPGKEDLRAARRHLVNRDDRTDRTLVSGAVLDIPGLEDIVPVDDLVRTKLDIVVRSGLVVHLDEIRDDAAVTTELVRADKILRCHLPDTKKAVILQQGRELRCNAGTLLDALPAQELLVGGAEEGAR